MPSSHCVGSWENWLAEISGSILIEMGFTNFGVIIKPLVVWSDAILNTLTNFIQSLSHREPAVCPLWRCIKFSKCFLFILWNAHGMPTISNVRKSDGYSARQNLMQCNGYDADPICVTQQPMPTTNTWQRNTCLLLPLDPGHRRNSTTDIKQ